MDKNMELSLPQAMKDFFGFAPGQGLGGFVAEIKKLTDADKAEIRAGLTKLGYKIKD